MLATVMSVLSAMLNVIITDNYMDEIDFVIEIEIP